MTILGTPQYCAPEILSRQPYSMQADIWSLGICTYYILTGFLPFPGSGLETMLDSISNFRIRSIPHDLSLSNEVKDFVTRCLQRDPRNRFRWDDIPGHPFLLGELLGGGKREGEGKELVVGYTKGKGGDNNRLDTLDKDVGRTTITAVMLTWFWAPEGGDLRPLVQGSLSWTLESYCTL